MVGGWRVAVEGAKSIAVGGSPIDYAADTIDRGLLAVVKQNDIILSWAEAGDHIAAERARVITGAGSVAGRNVPVIIFETAVVNFVDEK